MPEPNQADRDPPELSDDFVEDGAIGWGAWYEDLERRRFDGWSSVLSIMLGRLDRLYSRLCNALRCDLKKVKLPALVDEVVCKLESPVWAVRCEAAQMLAGLPKWVKVHGPGRHRYAPNRSWADPWDGGQSSPASIVGALEKRLDDPDARVKRIAVHAIAAYAELAAVSVAEILTRVAARLPNREIQRIDLAFP